MKFGVDLTPELIPCHIYDADGVEIRHVIEGDTETGVCTCYETDPERPNSVLIDHEAGEIVRKIVIAKLPLTIVRG